MWDRGGGIFYGTELSDFTSYSERCSPRVKTLPGGGRKVQSLETMSDLLEGEGVGRPSGGEWFGTIRLVTLRSLYVMRQGCDVGLRTRRCQVSSSEE